MGDGADLVSRVALTASPSPAVSALTALCKEAAGGMIAERTIRAMLKAAAYTRNIRDFNYSMASTDLQNPDWKDGGGNTLGESVFAYCTGEGNGYPVVRWGDDDGDLNGGERFPFDPGPCEWCDENSPSADIR